MLLLLFFLSLSELNKEKRNVFVFIRERGEQGVGMYGCGVSENKLGRLRVMEAPECSVVNQ